MKKNYETPLALLLVEDDNDIIKTSAGDTPLTDVFDW